jgi:hypothetical protein
MEGVPSQLFLIGSAFDRSLIVAKVRYPFCAKAKEVSNPIPVEPPVMTTTGSCFRLKFAF